MTKTLEQEVMTQLSNQIVPMVNNLHIMGCDVRRIHVERLPTPFSQRPPSEWANVLQVYTAAGIVQVEDGLNRQAEAIKAADMEHALR